MAAKKRSASSKTAAKKVAVKKSRQASSSGAAQGHTAVFVALRKVFADTLPRLQVLKDTDKEYTLHTRVASPFKQHKGGPMFFASVRNGKAYASFHLFPLYMNKELTAMVSPELKKRMQGLTCFNFKAAPEPQLLAELKQLTEAGLKAFDKTGWA